MSKSHLTIFLFCIFFFPYIHCCTQPGKCENSILVDYLYNQDESSCMEQCLNNEECNWVSMDRDNNHCYIWSNCQSISNLEEDCGNPIRQLL